MTKRIITSESVTEGHPDKVCDLISDSILDELLKKDIDSHVAVETLATRGMVLVAGEVTSNAYIDVQKVIRDTIKKIGYDNSEKGFDYDSIAVLTAIHPQSSDIALGVNKKNEDEQGAGDQGMVYGYATDETKEMMPLPTIIAHKLAMRLAYVRKKGILPYLGPDGKSEVAVEYDNDKVKRVHSVVIACQHSSRVEMKKLRKDVEQKVIKPVLGKLMDKNTEVYINATGRFTIGGPAADTGLTGRKIIVDTYGGIGRHGGGAFSGKDPSKVDRSGAYMARYIAKNIVAAKLAKKCEIEIAYAIGMAKPLGIYIDTFGTSTVDEERIAEAVEALFPLSPAKIIKKLDLKRPIYHKTAAYGHFGRNDPDFSWEKTDMVKPLREYLGLD
ncbi:MAG: S-adenosylmethionine synthetase [Candidatus Woesearchaeota archaeon]|nr:S-adenosylmethionine synthetase [Candidatus Woesearchaeota archaeon]